MACQTPLQVNSRHHAPCTGCTPVLHLRPCRRLPTKGVSQRRPVAKGGRQNQTAGQGQAGQGHASGKRARDTNTPITMQDYLNRKNVHACQPMAATTEFKKIPALRSDVVAVSRCPGKHTLRSYGMVWYGMA